MGSFTVSRQMHPQCRHAPAHSRGGWRVRCRRPRPASFACGSVKAWTTSPKVSSAQRAPAAVISASKASRSAFGAIGSAAPCTASTAALMSPRLAGCGVVSVPCMDTTACTSAPVRARSRTLRPPKQKPMAARRLMSPIARRSASRVNVSSAAAMRRRMPGTSDMNGRRNSIGILRPDRPVAFAEHVGDEDDIALAREHLAGLDRRLDDAPPIWRHQQERPRRLHALVPDQRAATADAGHRIEDALDGHCSPPLSTALIQ